MRGKRLYFDVVAAYTAYARSRIVDKTSQEDAYKAASEVTGINCNTLRIRASREGWEGRLGDLLPVLKSCITTSTTEHDVLDQQRQKYLKIADRIARNWDEGMTYLEEKFIMAKVERNHDRCAEILRQMNSLALMARRAQEIAGHATCDSGSSLAVDTSVPDTAGAGNTIRIILAKEIANPRIPQPRPEPQTIDFRVVEGS